MRNYRPFDEPYGIATLSGIKERGKGTLLYVIGNLLFISWFMLLAGLTITTEKIHLEVLAFAVTSPLLLLSIALHALGFIWMLFPEWRPDLRQRIMW